jgi:hemoglobin/transferrin/lactoferrin receptor protein
VSVAYAADFERLAMEDAGDLVRFEPLVEIPFDLGGTDPFVPYQSPGYAAYAIRGVGGNRVLLQLDGIRQPEIMSGSGGTRTDLFDPLLLSSLEILKGTASSLYGSDAMAGVIALETRARTFGVEPSLRLRAGYDGANAGSSGLVLASGGAGAVEAWVGFAARRGRERANFGEVPENPERRGSRHGLATIAWQPRAAHRLDLTVEQFWRDERLDYDSAEGFQPALFLDLTEISFASRQERRRASLRHDWVPAAGRVEGTRMLLYRQSAQTDARSRQVGVSPLGFGGRDRTDRIEFAQTQTGFEANVTGRLEAGPGAHRWTVGLSLETATAENDFTRTDLLPLEVTQDLIGMAPSRTGRGAIFLQDEWSLGRWRLIAGLRMEHYRIRPKNTDAYVNRLNERLPEGFPPLRAVDYDLDSGAPSVAVSRRWGESLLAYARYAKGYRQPTAEEFTGLFYHGADFVVLPNAELTEESSDAWELGLKWHRPRLSAEAAVFLTDYENFFQTVDTGARLDPDDPLSLWVQQVRNVGAARVRGFEAALRYELLPVGHAGGSLRLNATIGQAWGRNLTLDAPLASVSPLKAVVALSWESRDGRGGLDLSVTHRARHHAPPDEAAFVPAASTVVELSGAWRVTERVRVQATVRNLFDARYHLWSHSNQGIHFPDDPDRATLPGRHVSVAVECRF